MKKILHARYTCIAVSVFAVTALAIFALWLWWKPTQEQPVFYKTEAYAIPDSEQTLELRKWHMPHDQSNSGWSFYLVTADGAEKLLKSVHAANYVVVTDVIWTEEGAEFQTHGGPRWVTVTWA